MLKETPAYPIKRRENESKRDGHEKPAAGPVDRHPDRRSRTLRLLPDDAAERPDGAATAIDGDSIRIAGEEVRIKGIDAPELHQTCTVSGRQTACGRESLAALRRLLSSGLATCVGGERDRYGRLLALCRVRGIDVGATMVREGRAVAFGAYETEEAEARSRYAGLWAGEFERPRDCARATHSEPNGSKTKF